MNQPVPVCELDIVGYAEVLPPEVRPAVVPPVFQKRDPDGWALVPPFTLAGDFVLNGAWIPPAELAALQDLGQITLFSHEADRRAAQPGHTLWIDLDRQIRYEPTADVKRQLESIAQTHIDEAKAAIRERRFQDAELACGIAIAANSRRVEPFALKAAIRRLDPSGRYPSSEALQRHLARTLVDDSTFDVLVTNACAEAASPALPPVRRDASRMANMATLPPRSFQHAA